MMPFVHGSHRVIFTVDDKTRQVHLRHLRHAAGRDLFEDA